MKRSIILTLKLYRKILSPLLVIIFGNACRFSPNCSEYSIMAIEKYGILFGGKKAIIRFLRCNPFTKPAFDPV